ncbi:MAG TPA: hypothetical protein VHN77_09305 [Phycisphaerales bacterium]|nr:hypothetical protein [Phycisphaerales bacterium]
MANPPSVKKQVLQVDDWADQAFGRFILVGERAKKEWDGLTIAAQEGLMQRARMANLSSQPRDKSKLHWIKGKKAKGSLELKYSAPLARGFGFKRGKDWCMTSFTEGQHPTNRDVLNAGTHAIKMRDEYYPGG